MVHCHACGNLLKGTEGACPVCGMPYQSPHLPPGTKLRGGKYSIGKVLGQGGFGITYQGADLTLGRPVAIKEFFPDGSSRRTHLLVPPTSFGQSGLQSALESFLEEARTLARFRHPGIVDVLEVFEENFTAYLVMELLQGETLGKRIARVGALEPREVTDLALRVADALERVHDAGLLHRDIKPDNLFLTEDGRTVLIDFGSARAYASGQTVNHTRLVTPGYAPLEQYTTEAKFGPYTDIYALAATLYHAATGTPPPPVTNRLAGSELPPLPPSLPAGLRAAIEQGMRIRTDERPSSVAAFRELLRQERPIQPAPEAPAPLPPVPVPERTERYDVLLRHSGLLRFLVVAELSNLTGLGPLEAMRLASEGGIVARNVERRDAQTIARQLQALGADVAVTSAGAANERSGSQRSPQRAPQPRPPHPRAPQPHAPSLPALPFVGCVPGCALGCLMLLILFIMLGSGGYFLFSSSTGPEFVPGLLDLIRTLGLLDLF